MPVTENPKRKVKRQRANLVKKNEGKRLSKSESGRRGKNKNKTTATRVHDRATLTRAPALTPYRHQHGTLNETRI